MDEPVLVIVNDGHDARYLIRRGAISAHRSRRKLVVAWLATGWLPNLHHPSANEAIARRLHLGAEELAACERLIVVERSSDASIRKLMQRASPAVVIFDSRTTDEDTLQRVVRYCADEALIVALDQDGTGEGLVHIYSSDRLRH